MSCVMPCIFGARVGRTDDRGEFTARFLPGGSYVIDVHRARYKPASMALSVEEGLRILAKDLELTPAEPGR